MFTWASVLLLLALCMNGCEGSESAVEMSRDLNLLVKDGFHPAWIIDGGANVGKWSSGIIKMFPEASILMLDANERHTEALTTTRDAFRQMHPNSYFDFKFALLGDREGRNATFFARKEKIHHTGDSMFLEQTRAYSNKGRNAVKATVQHMRTVDGLWNEFVKEAPASVRSRIGDEKSVGLLKLDIQGGEMGALAGSVEVLKQVQVVMCELSVSPLNAGAPLMFETLVMLRRYGFIMYDITDIVRWSRGAIQVDALFVHKDSPLWGQDKIGLPPPQTPPKTPYLRHLYQQALHDLWRESKRETTMDMATVRSASGKRVRDNLP